MLDGDYSERLAELLDRFPCRVELPSEWGDYFLAQGTLHSIADDHRRFVRHILRVRAILETASSLPAIPRPHAYSGVYTRDISREGVSFLHTEQLFPGERGLLWLSTRKLAVTVMRCVRHNPRCYVVGCS